MPQSGREVVIVEAVRTPVGRGHPEKGYYKDTHPNELLGKVFTEVIERAGIEPSLVEDVIGEVGARVRDRLLVFGTPAGHQRLHRDGGDVVRNHLFVDAAIGLGQTLQEVQRLADRCQLPGARVRLT